MNIYTAFFLSKFKRKCNVDLHEMKETLRQRISPFSISPTFEPSLSPLSYLELSGPRAWFFHASYYLFRLQSEIFWSSHLCMRQEVP